MIVCHFTDIIAHQIIHTHKSLFIHERLELLLGVAILAFLDLNVLRN